MKQFRKKDDDEEPRVFYADTETDTGTTSITIDGISLTVVGVSDRDFSVSIIPHTQANTALADRKTGDLVNLETDIIGKYVEKLLQPYSKEEIKSAETGGLTEDFLRLHGF